MKVLSGGLWLPGFVVLRSELIQLLVHLCPKKQKKTKVWNKWIKVTSGHVSTNESVSLLWNNDSSLGGVTGTSHYESQSSRWGVLTIRLVEGKSLSTRGQRATAKTPTWQHFLGVLESRNCPVKKYYPQYLWDPNSSQMDKFFFLNLYKIYNLSILIDFYLILSSRICPRSSQPHGHSVKPPLCYGGEV